MAERKVIKTITVDGSPNHVSMVPGGRYAYVTSIDTDNLTIIDTNTYEVMGQIKLGKSPHEIDFVKKN